MQSQTLTLQVSNFQRRLLSAVLDSPHRITLLPGGRGGGKTFGAVLALMLLGQRMERPLMLLGGTTYQNIRNNAEGAVEFWAEALKLSYRWPTGASRLQVGDQRWEVKGMQRTLGKSQVQGRTYSGAFIDETTETLEENFKMLFTSVRAPGSRLILAWNPVHTDHWVEELLLKDPEAIDAEVLHSTMGDNKFLEADVQEALHNRALYRDFEWQRLILGLPADPEGLVYPHWTAYGDGGHLAGNPCVVGADYGESGVTAAVYFQQDTTGTWVVTREYYYDGHIRGRRSAEAQARDIVEAAPGRILAAYVDPASPALRNALLAIGCPAMQAWNDAKGYDLTNAALQGEQLVIDQDKCPALTQQLRRLVYNARLLAPDPACVDHSTDALRYGWCGIATGAQVGRLVVRH